MSLFQQAVLKKYLKGLVSEKVTVAYERFTNHFHNLTIQENIRNSKEEQYQGEFLIDLFVNVLGYIKNPTPEFNLTTELKNIKGSKKTDGAILKGETALAVIELKGTGTADLSKVETQAFGYKNNQPGCKYVITSNFEKLRFYIDNAVDFEEFNLFQLTKERFEILWLCLSSEYLLKNIPKKIKDESLTQEETVTKKLYKDYALFRNEIFATIQKENQDYDKLTLFKKTQKLLDRFLFIFFAEDRLLLPPNSIRSIVTQWTDLRDKYDAYTPLYERFKKYFGYMNTGYKGEQHDIFAYNGGLFAPDEVLDNIKINDELLYKHTVTLSNYDFESEVGVNILGHIFEHSLNDIDQIQAEIQGVATEKTKTKRKKDGVFYTPKYITKYIVENTVGKLCEEKKTALDIQEAEYEKERKGRQKKTIKKLTEKLEEYRKWLLQITICDPACGSGAFLNQALEFLIAEHSYIDQLQAKLFGDAMVLSEVENAILENNLFGVDINEESVDIAKLSLWLRTAQKGRKLTSLSNNIKCGNSLIDDPTVAGNKAFKWEEEFTHIFKEKEKKAFHITTATHDSRTSQRMIDYKVRELRDNGTRPKPEGIWLEPKDELLITQTIAEIVKKDNLNVMAFNICGDHIHLLLVCEKEELSKIVGKIKGKTSRIYNNNKGITIRGHVPLSKGGKKTYNSLWTQKFGTKEIKDEKQLWNTVEYIQNNRVKHQLPTNKGINPLVKKGKEIKYPIIRGINPLVKIINDMCCTYEHAFRMEKKGGFDVIIGNPPYVRVQSLKEHYFDQTVFYEKEYKSATGKYDLYILFIEKSFSLINVNGIVSFILPHKFLVSDFGIGIRAFLIENKAVDSLVHFGSKIVFQDVATYTCIINIKKQNQFLRFAQINPNDIISTFEFGQIDYKNLGSKAWLLKDSKTSSILSKITSKTQLNDLCEGIYQGLITTGDDIFMLEGEHENGVFTGYSKALDGIVKLESGILKEVLKGQDIKRYLPLKSRIFVIYPHKINEKGKTIPFEEDEFKSKNPLTYEYLENFKEDLISKKIRYKTNPKYWYSLHRSREISIFEKNYIITPQLQNFPSFTIKETDVYADAGGYLLLPKKKINFNGLLAILNSKVLWFFIKNTSSEYGGGYFYFKTKYLEPFGIPLETLNSSDFNKQIESRLKGAKNYNNVIDTFIKYFQFQFTIEKLSQKLQNWHDLAFGEFIKELNKIIKKENKQRLNNGLKPIAILTKIDEMEWMEVFETKKTEVQTLKAQIDKIDNQIDQMVYELYGLSEEEIKIVEEG